MADDNGHDHGMEIQEPVYTGPNPEEIRTILVEPDLDDELKPVESPLADPHPVDIIPPKPSDKQMGIDNRHRDAALAAVRVGKPLQKGAKLD